MRNSLKVGKWEFKRNIKNKSFIISLIITPLIMLLFTTAPALLANLSEDEPTKVYIQDELGVLSVVEPLIEEDETVNWEVEKTSESLASMKEQLQAEEDAAYVLLDEETIQHGEITFAEGQDVGSSFEHELMIFEQPIKQLQLQQAGLTEDQMNIVTQPMRLNQVALDHAASDSRNVYETAIPAGFSGLILFSIVISGMMIFQSASQEKKDKVAEIILSSITPNELMQGKIIGYFALGILQVALWLVILIPIVIWRFDLPVFEYLFVPQTLLLLLVAILGYLLFAAMFVGLGATLEDASTGGNFQGLVMMLPFLPVIFIGPVLSNPEGLVAQIASYVPFTSPAILILRLSLIDEWPWLEIILSLVILIASIWIFMKLAGKIFKVGILIYGKNATPQEIWKWLRA